MANRTLTTNCKRKRNNFTIREDIMKEFKKYIARQNDKLSMSRRVEIYMENILKEDGVNIPMQA